MKSLHVVGIVTAVIATGCKDIAGSQKLPAGTPDPKIYNNATGALGMRNSALLSVVAEIPDYIATTGLFTDELESDAIGASAGVISGSALPVGGALDERILPSLTSGIGTQADAVYGNLQRVRGLASQALGALAVYDTTQHAPVLRGELYALSGYAEILLADFFCDGVPLSTLDFQSDFTYHAGSTAAQVYQDAISKEDSALALAGASDTVKNLARVLKGRALLALGQYTAAAQAVAAVPGGFHYSLDINMGDISGSGVGGAYAFGGTTMADMEGANGLPYLSSNDPRTADTVFGQTMYGLPLGLPNKYKEGVVEDAGTVAFPIADWIEARLIQAEAALQSHPTDPSWLTILNELRRTATVPGMSQAFAPTDTVTDPGSGSSITAARIKVLFQERAYWLYLTGHRQGDLRRLIRQYSSYGFSQEHIYPVGSYLAPGARIYGSDVTAPIPSTEYANPLFHGCIDRHA